jgi:hypothetical protein
VSRLDQLEAAVGIAEENRAEADDALARALHQRDAIVVDESVIDHAASIDALAEGRQSHQESLRDLPRRRAELAVMESELAGALGELGNQWSIERVLALDSSLVARQAIAEHARAMTESDKAHDRARLALEPLLAHRDELLAGQAQTRACLDATAEPEDPMEALLGRQAVIEAAGSLSSRPPTSFAPAPGAVATLGFVSALATGGGYLVSGWSGAFVGAIAAAGAAVGAFLLARTGARRAPSDQLADVATEREAIKAALATHEARAALARELDEIGGRLRHAETRIARAQAGVDEAARRMEATRETWRRHADGASLIGVATPEAALDLLAQARVVAERQRAVDAMAHRVRAIEADIHRYEDAIARTWSAVEGNALPPEGSAAKLMARLAAARETSKDALHLEATVRDCRDNSSAAERRLEASRAALSDHLSHWRAGDGDDLRTRAKDWAEREATERDLRAQEALVVQAAGSRDGFEPFVAELESTPAEVHELERDTTEERIRHLSAEHNRLLTAVGGFDSELATLEAGGETSALLAKREELRARARELADEWATLRVARLLIERARARYERERQPAVVRAAQEYFAAMTLGRYRQIKAPLGEAVLRVVDSDGAEKTPEQLSRGTREQLYLSLRFGLIEQFTERSGPLPIVVDEILVNFDRERALQAARGFATLARRHQVIAFTCHEWVVDLFREADEDTRVWHLYEMSERAAAPETEVVSRR